MNFYYPRNVARKTLFAKMENVRRIFVSKQIILEISSRIEEQTICILILEFESNTFSSLDNNITLEVNRKFLDVISAIR